MSTIEIQSAIEARQLKWAFCKVLLSVAKQISANPVPNFLELIAITQEILKVIQEGADDRAAD